MAEMYQRLTQADGIGAVLKYMSLFDITPSADGVEFAPPDGNSYYDDVAMAPRLQDWLLDLRLLRPIPIAYLVPDAALLPPESIRFFNVDLTWVDRVVDGVFAAANTGTVDSVFSAALLAMVRQRIDNQLVKEAQKKVPGSDWTIDDGMTGMLIRSDLVRRWPDMIIRAYKTIQNDPANPDDLQNLPELPVLRAEAISRSILIAIIGGSPQMVHVQEPHVGVRFGVDEETPGTTNWVVNQRDSDGNFLPPQPGTPPPPPGSPEVVAKLPVIPKHPDRRTLDILNLAGKAGNTPRMVALQLERRPYVQEFFASVPESNGSVPLSAYMNDDGSFKILALGRGRTLNLDALRARMVQLQQSYPKEKP